MSIPLYQHPKKNSELEEQTKPIRTALEDFQRTRARKLYQALSKEAQEYFQQQYPNETAQLRFRI